LWLIRERLLQDQPIDVKADGFYRRLPMSNPSTGWDNFTAICWLNPVATSG